jgi:hypothetical protein
MARLRSRPPGADSADVEGITMPIRVEAYTATGIATGDVVCLRSVRDALDSSTELTIGGASWLAIDGAVGPTARQLSIATDELLLVVADEPDGIPVHAQWHNLELDAGPYRVRGQMPTMPGFDPGRALARPNGGFVLLRDGRIELIGRPDAGEATAAQLLVNRYTVDRIEADLMLGFFFPGAAMTVTGTQAAASRAGDGAEAVSSVEQETVTTVVVETIMPAPPGTPVAPVSG